MLLAQSALDRLAGLGGAEAALASIAVAAAIVFCLAMGALNRRRGLLATYFLCLFFSSHSIELLDAGSRALRWVVLVASLLCATYGGLTTLGLQSRLYMAYAVLCVASALWTTGSALSAVSRGLLFAALVFVSGTIWLSRYRGADRVLSLVASGARLSVVYALVGVSGYVGFAGGTRFSGLWESAPLVAMTGACLSVIALTDVMSARRISDKPVSVFVCIVTALLTVTTGQRTGLLGLLVGWLVVLAEFRRQRLLLALPMIVGVIIVTYQMMQVSPEHAEFLAGRFGSDSSSGRVERWLASLDAALQRPIFGHGAGAHERLQFGIHNAYLTAFYDLGLCGLALFAGAIIATAVSAARIARQSSAAARSVGRCCLALIIAMATMAFFESKQNSPTNFLAMLAVLAAAIVHLRGPLADNDGSSRVA